MTHTTTDLAAHLANLHARDCQSMGAEWGPADAYKSFDSGTLAGWLREYRVAADEAELRCALRAALEELKRTALPENVADALGALMGTAVDAWRDALRDGALTSPAAVLDAAIVEHVEAGGMPVAPAFRARLLRAWEDHVERARQEQADEA